MGLWKLDDDFICDVVVIPFLVAIIAARLTYQSSVNAFQGESKHYHEVA